MSGGRATPRFEFSCNPSGRLSLAGDVEAAGEYHLDDRLLSDAIMAPMPGPLADLIDVAVAVYIADRLCRRRAGSGDRYEHRWQRRMELRIAVRFPDLWNDARTLASLHGALAYLTEDDWDFTFTSRPRTLARDAEVTNFLFREALPQPVAVALFSGGLDSLAGACEELVREPSGSLVLVSGNTTSRILPAQRFLIDALRAGSRRKVVWARAAFGMKKRNPRAYDGDERTQRTRAFAFVAAGAAAAALAQVNALQLYENGIGAINLPYTDAQLGAESTRAMHPRSVELLEELVRLVALPNFSLVLPNLFRTKAELCSVLKQPGFHELAARSVSCDGFPQRIRGVVQCGVCTSCVLRRQALAGAGLEDGTYRHDIFRRDRLPESKSFVIRAMADQARRIGRAVGHAGDWPGLLNEFPMLLDLPDSIDDYGKLQIAQMYQRYSSEWARFEAMVANG